MSYYYYIEFDWKYFCVYAKNFQKYKEITLICLFLFQSKRISLNYYQQNYIIFVYFIIKIDLLHKLAKIHNNFLKFSSVK